MIYKNGILQTENEEEEAKHKVIHAIYKSIAVIENLEEAKMNILNYLWSIVCGATKESDAPDINTLLGIEKLLIASNPKKRTLGSHYKKY
jgi:hypothetical protein